MSEPRQPREFSDMSDNPTNNGWGENNDLWENRVQINDEMEEETEYPRNQSAVSENKVVVENNNGIFNCQNDEK